MTILTRIIRKISRVLLLQLHALSSKEVRDYSIKDRQDIAQHRTNIKIYDACIFFNELELLEIRLNVLYPYVDYFVIVESTMTFSGKPKLLYFNDHKERFAAFAHKIIHRIIDDTPTDRAELEARLQLPEYSMLDQEVTRETLTNSNVPKGQDMWLREFYQRESIKKALVGLQDTDICYISDIDEIWDPAAVIDYRTLDTVYKYRQTVYAYYLNNRSSEPWAGTFATSYKRIRSQCLNNMRDAAKTSYTYVPHGGWHFTNQGGASRIAQKIDAYSHQEFNTPDIKDTLEKNIAQNKDFVGRSFTFTVDESGLPRYLKDHKEKYQTFFR